jgi:DnaJ-class molecular chaperone
MFHKLGKGLGELFETDMMLEDFGGNASKTRGAVSIELTIGSKTVPSTFFVIDGKGMYSVLLGMIGSMLIVVSLQQCTNASSSGKETVLR